MAKKAIKSKTKTAPKQAAPKRAAPKAAAPKAAAPKAKASKVVDRPPPSFSSVIRKPFRPD